MVQLNEKNGVNLDNSYSQDGTVTFSSPNQNLTGLSKTRSRQSKSNNLAKASLHFMTVSREKNQKRQYFDWSNKPMLLITQEENPPRKSIASQSKVDFICTSKV